ncbi:hypothetical protein BGZ94_001834 [Podila epigama]|nr:hypothetical protein BGZ94_001834 [Podila epigama]
MLTVLSDTSRTMARSLEALALQINRTADLDFPPARQTLQRMSVRAARAMHRLASVQNTVFPMLANANFTGTRPGPVYYRFHPNNGRSRGTITQAATTRTTSTPSGSTNPASNTSSTTTTTTTTTAIAPLIAASRSHLFPSLSGEAGRAQGLRPHTFHFGPLASILTPTSASTSTSSATSRPPWTSLGMADTHNNPAAGRSSSSTPGALRNAVELDIVSAIYQQMDMDRDSRAIIDDPTILLRAEDINRLLRLSQEHQTRESTQAASSSSDSRQRQPNFYQAAADVAAATVRAERAATTGAAVAAAASSWVRSHLAGNNTSARGRARDTDELLLEGEARASQRRRVDQDEEHLQDANGTNNNNRRGSRPVSGASLTGVASQSRRGPTADSTQPASSGSSPSSPSLPGTSTMVASSSSSSSTSSSSAAAATAATAVPAATPAYNLGRIGVYISAILRMVDQPREDGSPRTLADVICNDPESMSTPLQDLVRDVASSVTIRETRSIVEGFPSPLRNIHPTLSRFIRERALMGQQLTETNLEVVAVMFAEGIMNAVHVEEILQTLSPPASIPISAADIRRISLDVLREHFRRLIYLVVAAPAGRESTWPTFARDLILWIRDVIGAWRVAFYSLIPERDQAEAQRVATHVVGSAIHANGRRWVELSNRATNTLVNVLCANIVPRRRGEEQAGGLVGGAWPLMATGPGAPRPSRSPSCMASSLLGSTAHPAPLGPVAAMNARPTNSGSSSTSPPSTSTSAATTASGSVAGSRGQSNPSGIQSILSSSIRPGMPNINDLLNMSAEEAYQSLQDLRRMLTGANGPSTTQSSTSSSSSSTRLGSEPAQAQAQAQTQSTGSQPESSPSKPANSRKTTVEDADGDEGEGH